MKRTIEIFSAGCAVCDALVKRVSAIACPSCEVVVLDMRQSDIAERTERLAVSSIPAVAIDGVLADCCAGGGPNDNTLRAAGLGRAIS